MIIKQISVMALSCLLLATGCANVQEKASNNIKEQEGLAARKLDKIRNNRTSEKDISSVRHSDRIWLGSRGYRQQNGDVLPNKYDNITYVSSKPQTVSEISSELSSITGMRFVVRDVESSFSSGSSGGESSDGGMSFSSSDGEGKTATLSYSGDFVGLLNQLSTKFDIFWEHRENVIYLSKYVTRTLALYSLPSITKLESEISSESDSSEDGGGDASKSGTDNKVELETSLDVWAEIEAVIKSMIPEGSSYAMSPSTGTLTITSSPLAIRKVENLVKKQNEILSRQVVIDVNVMSIVTNKVDSFKVNFDSILGNLSENYNFGWSGPKGNLTDVSDAASRFTSGFVSDSTENTVDLIVNALSEEFEKSDVTNSTVTTLNNHTVPLQIITRESYLKEMEQSVDEGIVTSSATAGDLTTGFVMNVLPRILANGEIILQYTMSISEKTGLEKLSYGGGDGVSPSFIQLPTVVSRDFLQNIKLKSGNTLILAGYDRNINDSEKTGTGNPNNYLLGGGKYGSMSKEILVIMITPRIIE